MRQSAPPSAPKEAENYQPNQTKPRLWLNSWSDITSGPSVLSAILAPTSPYKTKTLTLDTVEAWNIYVVMLSAFWFVLFFRVLDVHVWCLCISMFRCFDGSTCELVSTFRSTLVSYCRADDDWWLMNDDGLSDDLHDSCKSLKNTEIAKYPVYPIDCRHAHWPLDCEQVWVVFSSIPIFLFVSNAMVAMIAMMIALFSIAMTTNAADRPVLSSIVAINLHHQMNWWDKQKVQGAGVKEGKDWKRMSELDQWSHINHNLWSDYSCVEELAAHAPYLCLGWSWLVIA